MPKPPDRRGYLLLLGALVVAANAADFDFLPGILVGDPGRFHRGISHTWIAIGGFIMATILLARLAQHRLAVRFSLVLGLGFTGHLVLDMFSSWVDPHSGVPWAWPFSNARLLSPFPIFIGISLAPGTQNFIEGVFHIRNLYAVLWELSVAVVIWGLVYTTRKLNVTRSSSAKRSRYQGTEKSSFRPFPEIPARARRSRS
ncbi:MAG: metal-dependent hydrolase [Vicinamibacterales bacterium]